MSNEEAKKLAEHAGAVAAEAAALAAATEEQGAAPHLDAPAALAHPDAGAEATKGAEPTQSPATDAADEFVAACEAGKPRIALVGKYSDRTPVQLKSKAHLEELQRLHGEAAVKVQP